MARVINAYDWPPIFYCCRSRSGVRAAFGGVHPDLTKITNLLQLDVPISRAAEPALQATIVGPKGELTLTS